MALLAVREKFAELSGRHDLVVDFAGEDYDDNGANFYLQNGQRMLDRKFTDRKGMAWYKEDISAGAYSLDFRYCKFIEEVWAKASGEGRYRLEKKSLAWMRNTYGDAYADQDQGMPVYFAEKVLNLGPDQVALTAATYETEFTGDAEELMLADTDHVLYTGILFMPPADTTYTISVKGKFDSPSLVDGADTLTTYWTERHPDALVLAGMWSLEGFGRNTAGQQDYLQMILDILNDVDAEEAENESTGILQLGG